MFTALVPQQIEAEPQLPSLPPRQAQDCNAPRGNEPPMPADYNRSSGDPPGVNQIEQPDLRSRCENLGNQRPPHGQSSSNHRSMSDYPADDATLGPTRDDATLSPTRDDARNSESYQPSTRRRPSDSSEMELPRSVKRQRSTVNKNWSKREDEILSNCMMQGGSLLEAVEQLKSIGNGEGRSYEACKTHWNRRPISGIYEQLGPSDDDGTYSPHDARPDRRGRRGNFTQAWRAQEDAVLMREYAGKSTDWESVAVEVNRLCLVPRLPKPRRAGACKTRWGRINPKSDEESEDNEDDEEHEDHSQSTPPEMSITVTNLGDKGVALRGPTFTTGGSQHEHEELRNSLSTRRMPLRSYAQKLPIDSPQIPERPVNEVEPAQLDLLSVSEFPQHVPRRDVKRPPPGRQLSANTPHIDLTLPECAVHESESAPPGLLPLDELSQNAQQRGAELRKLSANKPKINPVLLERAVRDSKHIKPSTCRVVGQIVARQRQRKYGPAAGYGEKLLDDIAKELDIGLHRSTVIAVSYKELSGHDINPELFELAENDVEAAQTVAGDSDRMLFFCMCILWANLSPGREEAESLMDETEKLRKRKSEVRAGKGKWLCVAAHYRDLASKASARSGDANNISLGDCGSIRKTSF